MAITLSGTTITMNDSSTIVSTTTTDAIGSIAFAQVTSAVGRGGTIAGSGLRVGTGYQGQIYQQSHKQIGGTSLSGTWRNMMDGTMPAPIAVEGGTNYYVGILARVS